MKKLNFADAVRNAACRSAAATDAWEVRRGWILASGCSNPDGLRTRCHPRGLPHQQATLAAANRKSRTTFVIACFLN